MQNLLQQRCFNHAVREAVARCPECTQYFCRECITEHDDRVVCSACLKKLARLPLTARPAFVQTIRAAQFAAGFLLVWFCFFLLGSCLLKIPAAVHEGSVWRVEHWLDQK